MLGPLLLTFLGYAAAMGPVFLKRPDLPEPIPFLLLVIGAWWGYAVWRRRSSDARSWARGAGFACQIAVLVGHAVWYFGLATYSLPAEAPAEGGVCPDFVAERVWDGVPFQLLAQRGDASILLVFFRGPW